MNNLTLHNLSQGKGNKLKEEQLNKITLEVPKECNLMIISYIFPDGKNLYTTTSTIALDEIEKYKEDLNNVQQ